MVDPRAVAGIAQSVAAAMVKMRSVKRECGSGLRSDVVVGFMGADSEVRVLFVWRLRIILQACKRVNEPKYV